MGAPYVINGRTIESSAKPVELLARMGPDMYHLAYQRGMSLSGFLEYEDPSSDYTDGLDAFGRLLQVADIRTRSLPECGVYASSVDDLLGPTVDPRVRALFPEWAARQWRRAQVGHDVNTRALNASVDYAPGGGMLAWQQALQPRADVQIAPAIPLSELVAITTPIQGGAYQMFYITDEADEQRLVRVTEGAEIPGAKLTGGDKTLRLRKFGRRLIASYEFLRRMRLDWLSLHIQRLSVQAETDKVSAVLNVIINGDGNANTAAEEINMSTLDPSATLGTLSLSAWLAFKMQFPNPYMLTTALAREATALQMMLLNVGTANIPLVAIQGASGFGGFRQVNPGLADNVALGWTSGAPSLKIVAFDKRFAVERVTEIGASLQEVQRWTTNQTETLTLSEVEGYAVFDPSAAKVLDINE